MEISVMNENISSLQSAVSTEVLRKALTQDTQSAAALIQGMEQSNQKVMETSVTPHKGGSIDTHV